MRKIITKDGQVHSGWNSDFTDKGTHIEQKKGLLSGTTERIYKENISSDRESDTTGKIGVRLHKGTKRTTGIYG